MVTNKTIRELYIFMCSYTNVSGLVSCDDLFVNVHFKTGNNINIFDYLWLYWVIAEGHLIPRNSDYTHSSRLVKSGYILMYVCTNISKEG